jgi:serine/threonine protein phosphatase PrpC
MSGSWKFATASIIGTSHQKSPGGVCQDSHAAAYLESATAFIGIVSDGAGSASHAHIGSRLTCDVILREADAAEPAGLFTEAFARDTVEKLRAVLFKEADSKELTISDFACTMLVAIVSNERASFWQVGDGAICARDELGSIQLHLLAGEVRLRQYHLLCHGSPRTGGDAGNPARKGDS